MPNEIPVDTKAGELVLFDADNERLGLVAEYEHPILGTHAPVRRRSSTSRRRRARSHGPPPLVGQHTREILGWLGYADAEIDAAQGANGVVYWPDDDYAWTI